MTVLPAAPDDDPFGDVLDDRTVELALKSTLQAWIDAHLSHQERRWLNVTRPQDGSLYVTEQGQVDRPRSWPTISTLRLELHEQLPAIVLQYLGTIPGKRDPHGNFREVYRYQVHVAVPGYDEDDARWLASLYMAAVRSVLRQRKTLEGFAETTVLGAIQATAGVLIGDDNQLAGERAVYSCEAQIHVRSTVNENLGTPVPPDDPHDPDPPPPAPEEAEIVIEILEDTP